MNKKLGLAVAGAVLALSSAAQAGIVIPAGDWTLDIGGNVNAYYTSTRLTGDTTAGYATYWTGQGRGDALVGGSDANRTQNNITTGLLPNYLSVSGKTRQNDLDVAFTISINPGASTTQGGIQSAQNGNAATQENRQAFMTFGDKSWGEIKLGKDLGIYASDAILNDMTLLGVGSGAGGLAGNTTTTGRIGTGFMYADWKAQVAYTTPNWNGFQATVGVTQAFNAQALGSTSLGSVGRGGSTPAFEGKVSYSWTGDVSGKIWASAIQQKFTDIGTATDAYGSDTMRSYDAGASVSVGALNLVGYLYDGEGIGQTVQGYGGIGRLGKLRDSKGGYVQAKYTLPTNTTLGISWGQSRLETVDASDVIATGQAGKDLKDRMWAVGAYHALTKNLNLVAEYSDVKSEVGSLEGKGRTASFGAILFF